MTLRCDNCAKFARPNGGSFATIWDFVGMGLDHEQFRCGPCTERLGPAQSNARPADGDMSPYQWLVEA